MSPWRIALKTVCSLIVVAIIISTTKELVTDAPESPMTPSQIRFRRLTQIVIDIVIVVWFWLP